MICPNCGAELQEDDVFCCHCGYKVEKKEEPNTPVEDFSTPTIETFTPDNAPKKAHQNSPEGGYCPNCGAKTGAEDAFCMYCGYALKNGDPSRGYAQPIPPLDVPVGDVGFGGNGQPEIICAMCGCKIPASSVVCPVCQQPVRRNIPPRAQAYPARQHARKKPFNVFALLGFIFALLGLLSIADLSVGIIFTIPGLVLGIIGLVKSKKTGAGKGFAITAIVISGIAIAIFALVLMVNVLDAFTVSPDIGSDGSYYDSSYDYWGNGNFY